MKVLKRRIVCEFEEHCKTGLFTMKFDLLYHVCEYLHKFGSVRFQYASAYTHFSIFFKRAYRKVPITRASRMHGTI